MRGGGRNWATEAENRRWKQKLGVRGGTSSRGLKRGREPENRQWGPKTSGVGF